MRRLVDRMDELLRDESNAPATSHREIERRIGEAEAIAEGLGGLYRKPTAARAAPLWQDGKGRAGW